MLKRHLGFMVILVALLVIPLTGCGLLGETGAVTGTVTDKETGDPLEGVQVSIGTRTDETDEDGKYTLTDVRAGTQTIEGRVIGAIAAIVYKAYEADINVKGEETITHNFSMEPLGTKTEYAQSMLQDIRNYFSSIVTEGEKIFTDEYFEAFYTEFEEIFSQYLVFALTHVVEVQVVPIAVLEAMEGEEPGIIDVEFDWDNWFIEDWKDTKEHNEDFWVINVDDFIIFEVDLDMGEGLDPDDPIFLNIEILSITMEDNIPEPIKKLLPDNFDPSATDYSGIIELSSSMTWGELDELIDGDALPEDLSELFEFEIIWMEGTDDLLDGNLNFSGKLEINIIEFSLIEMEGNGKPGEVIAEIAVSLDGQFDGPGLEINGETELSASAHLHFGEESDEPEAVDLEVSISSATDIKFGTDLLAFYGALEKLQISGGMVKGETKDTENNNENNGEEMPFINEIKLIAQGGLYHNLVQVNETQIGIQNYNPEDWDMAIEGDIDINMQPKNEGAIYLSASGYLHFLDVKPFEGDLSVTLSFEEATKWLNDLKPENLDMEIEAYLGDTDMFFGDISVKLENPPIFDIHIENQVGYYMVLAFKGTDEPELDEDVESGIFCSEDEKLAKITIDEQGVFWIEWIEDGEETLF